MSRGTEEAKAKKLRDQAHQARTQEAGAMSQEDIARREKERATGLVGRSKAAREAAAAASATKPRAAAASAPAVRTTVKPAAAATSATKQPSAAAAASASTVASPVIATPATPIARGRSSVARVNPKLTVRTENLDRLDRGALAPVAAAPAPVAVMKAPATAAATQVTAARATDDLFSPRRKGTRRNDRGGPMRAPVASAPVALPSQYSVTLPGAAGLKAPPRVVRPSLPPIDTSRAPEAGVTRPGTPTIGSGFLPTDSDFVQPAQRSASPSVVEASAASAGAGAGVGSPKLRRTVKGSKLPSAAERQTVDPMPGIKNTFVLEYASAANDYFTAMHDPKLTLEEVRGKAKAARIAMNDIERGFVSIPGQERRQIIGNVMLASEYDSLYNLATSRDKLSSAQVSRFEELSTDLASREAEFNHPEYGVLEAKSGHGRSMLVDRADYLGLNSLADKLIDAAPLTQEDISRSGIDPKVLVTTPEPVAPAVAEGPSAKAPKRSAMSRFSDGVKKRYYKMGAALSGDAGRAEFAEKRAALADKRLSAAERALVAGQQAAATAAKGRLTAVTARFADAKRIAVQAKPQIALLDKLTKEKETLVAKQAEKQAKIKALEAERAQTGESKKRLVVAISAKETEIDGVPNQQAVSTTADRARAGKVFRAQAERTASEIDSKAKELKDLRNQLESATALEAKQRAQVQGLTDEYVKYTQRIKVLDGARGPDSIAAAQAAVATSAKALDDVLPRSAVGSRHPDGQKLMLEQLVAAGGDIEKAAKATKGTANPDAAFGEAVKARTDAQQDVVTTSKAQRSETKAVVKTREAILAEDNARKGLNKVQVGLNKAYVAAKEAHSIATEQHSSMQRSTAAAEGTLDAAKERLTALKGETADLKAAAETAAQSHKSQSERLSRLSVPDFTRNTTREIASIDAKLAAHREAQTESDEGAHMQSNSRTGEGIDTSSISRLDDKEVQNLEGRRRALEADLQVAQSSQEMGALKSQVQSLAGQAATAQEALSANGTAIAQATTRVQSAETSLSEARGAEKTAKAGLSIAEKGLAKATSALDPIARAEIAREQKADLERSLAELKKAGGVVEAANAVVASHPPRIQSLKGDIERDKEQLSRAQKSSIEAQATFEKASKGLATAQEALRVQTEKVSALRTQLSGLQESVVVANKKVLDQTRDLSRDSDEDKAFKAADKARITERDLHNKVKTQYEAAALEEDNMKQRLPGLKQGVTLARAANGEAYDIVYTRVESLLKKQEEFTKLTSELQGAKGTIDQASAMEKEIARLAPLTTSKAESQARGTLDVAKGIRHNLSGGSKSSRDIFGESDSTPRYQAVKGILRGDKQIAASRADGVARKDEAIKAGKAGTSVEMQATAPALVADKKQAEAAKAPSFFARAGKAIMGLFGGNKAEKAVPVPATALVAEVRELIASFPAERKKTTLIAQAQAPVTGVATSSLRSVAPTPPNSPVGGGGGLGAAAASTVTLASAPSAQAPASAMRGAMSSLRSAAPTPPNSPVSVSAVLGAAAASASTTTQAPKRRASTFEDAGQRGMQSAEEMRRVVSTWPPKDQGELGAASRTMSNASRAAPPAPVRTTLKGRGRSGSQLL